MTRLFVAVPLPGEVKDQLFAIRPPVVPGLRLVCREDLHLTLHFLGERAGKEEMIHDALATVKASPFTITLTGVGQFPDEGSPQVLWAGVERNPALSALHRAVGTALAEGIGFEPEERPYRPHVTLGRVRSPVPPDVIEDFMEQNRTFRVASVPVDQFALFSSALRKDGPEYRVEAEFHLRGTESTI